MSRFGLLYPGTRDRESHAVRVVEPRERPDFQAVWRPRRSEVIPLQVVVNAAATESVSSRLLSQPYRIDSIDLALRTGFNSGILYAFFVVQCDATDTTLDATKQTLFPDIGSDLADQSQLYSGPIGSLAMAGMEVFRIPSRLMMRAVNGGGAAEVAVALIGLTFLDDGVPVYQ